MNSRFSPAAAAGFELFFRPWMRRRLHALRFAGLPRALPADRPLLLVSNHVSWWDGFVMRELQRLLRPGAPLYTLMLERELRRLPYFRWIGVVGIDPAAPARTARAARLLERRVRERPDAVISLFPQGRIWPSHRRPLGFQRGAEWFASRLGPLTVLPVAVHLEPLNASAPTLFAVAGEPLAGAEVDAAALEGRVESLLDQLHALLDRHGEDVHRLWPGAFDPLPDAPASHPAGLR